MLNAAQTDAGRGVLRLVRASGRQLRMGMSGPVGLDMGAILLMAAHMNVDCNLLMRILPEFEAILLNKLTEASDG